MLALLHPASYPLGHPDFKDWMIVGSCLYWTLEHIACLTSYKAVSVEYDNMGKC